MRRRSWLYEAPLFFFSLWVVERLLFPRNPSFFYVSPHPYWAGVLLFCLRYGLAAGVFSGALAALTFVTSYWFFGDRFRFEDPEFYVLPGLFVTVGALIGVVVDRYWQRARSAEGREEAANERAAAMRQELDIQQKTTRAVEERVVTQMSTMVTLYQGARDLGSLDRKALLNGILDFFSSAVHAEKAAVYLREGEHWALHRSLGWEDGDDYPRKIEAAQGLIGKAGSENKVVSLRDWFGTDVERAWSERGKADAVMAGPLRRDTGEVIGVYSVQGMELLRFNSGSVNLLALLVDWAEASISKCLYFEELRSKLILDEVYGIYNERYLRDRSEQEFIRSKEYSLPLSLLLISVEGLDRLARHQQVNVLRATAEMLQRASRKIDIVTKSAVPDAPFAVLMITGTVERARAARDAILKAAAKLGVFAADHSDENGFLSLRVGVGSYESDMTSMEDIVAQARNDLG